MDVMSVVLPLAGGVATFLLGEFTSRRRLAESRADKLMFENLARRQAAYDTLFKAARQLEEYVWRFTRPDCHSFKETLDPSEFAPLSAWDTFARIAEEVGLWLDEPTRAAISRVQQGLYWGSSHAYRMASLRITLEHAPKHPKNLASAVADDARKELSSLEASVWNWADKQLQELDQLKTIMRRSLGLEELDAEIARLRIRAAARERRTGLLSSPRSNTRSAPQQPSSLPGGAPADAPAEATPKKERESA